MSEHEAIERFRRNVANCEHGTFRIACKDAAAILNVLDGRATKTERLCACRKWDARACLALRYDRPPSEHACDCTCHTSAGKAP